MQDMSAEEVADLWVTAKLVGNALHAAHPTTDSLTYTIQDGPSAGQTVPHVHIHVMPRCMTDAFNARRKNDEIYEAIDKAEKAVGRVDAPDDKPGRTGEDMASEAAVLRGFIGQLSQ